MNFIKNIVDKFLKTAGKKEEKPAPFFPQNRAGKRTLWKLYKLENGLRGQTKATEKARHRAAVTDQQANGMESRAKRKQLQISGGFN